MILDAPTFDRIEARAAQYGGVGSGNYHDRERHPLCLYGLALDRSVVPYLDWNLPEWRVLCDAGCATWQSDRVVAQCRTWIRALTGHTVDRVPFSLFCQMLGLERGH